MKQKKFKLLSILLMIMVIFATVGADPHMTYAAVTTPGKTSMVSVENESAGIKIKWKKASNAKGYYVYRKSLSSSFQKIATVKNNNKVSYIDKSVKSKINYTYIYTVRAYNGKALGNYDTLGLKITRDDPVPIQLSIDSFTIGVGSSLTIDAKVSGTSQKIVWTSSNTKVATVKNGTVTGKNAGTATITAKANGKTAKCAVTVVKPVKTNDYKKLYKDFLSKNTLPVGQANSYIPEYYYVGNIGIEYPVLIVEGKVKHYPNSDGTNTLFVYTIKNNKVVQVSMMSLTNFDGYFYYNKKYKSLYSHRDEGGYVTDELVAIHGEGYATMQHANKAPGPEYSVGFSYLEKDKTVSKTEYDKFFKKYFTGVAKYKMLSNTAANRAKTFA